MKLLAAAFLALASVLARAEISVAFPAERQRLPAVDQTYVIGAVSMLVIGFRFLRRDCASRAICAPPPVVCWLFIIS